MQPSLFLWLVYLYRLFLWDSTYQITKRSCLEDLFKHKEQEYLQKSQSLKHSIFILCELGETLSVLCENVFFTQRTQSEINAMKTTLKITLC